MKKLNFYQTVRSLLPKCSSDAKIFSSDVYKESTQARKYQADGLQFGRSMVEMLGVLAIIGVLSVGAIAGYQKAMMKYKLNKQAQQLNTIINAVSKHYYSFLDIAKGANGIIITPYFIKLGEIPKEMIKDKTNYLYDVFNNYLYISIEGNGSWVALYINLELTKDSDNNLKICQNIINTAKENSASITWLLTRATIEGDSYPTYTNLRGDAICSEQGCLRNISLDDIQRLCVKTTQKDSMMKIQWHF